MKSFFKYIIWFIWFPVCNSQVHPEIPTISGPDFPDAELKSVRSFTGTSLFGYMNGGAELYLEYGCTGAEVSEVVFHGGKYKVEIFRMLGANEAFGIFSVSKFRCIDAPVIAKYTCRTKYQFQFCKGSFYVSIINSTGKKTDSTNMVEIGKIISGKISDPEADLTGFLPGIPGELFKNSFLVKGRLGLVNSFPDLEDFFHGSVGYTAIMLKNERLKTLVSVKFGDKESYARFLGLHQINADKIKEGDFAYAGGLKVKNIADYHLFLELPQ